MIRILIVDDQKVIRERLRLALEEQDDFVVVGTAEDGDRAISQIALLQPDLVLLDIEMPGRNGFEVAVVIRERFPRTRTIILSSHDDVESIRSSLQSGVNGYVAKQKIDSSMVEIIRSVHRGHSQFGPGILEKVLTQSSALVFKEPLVNGTLQNQEETALVVEASEIVVADPTALKTQDTFTADLVTEERFDDRPEHNRLTDWSNAAKEIIDGVPLPWTRGLFYMLLAFAGVAIPWAIFFQMDEIGTARGRLELVGDTVKREADIPSNATVTKVLVKKGDLVTKGQIIMELDSKDIKDQIQQNQVKLDGQQQRISQLQISKNQLAIALNTQQQQNQSQISEKQAQIAQAQQNLSSLRNNYNNQASEKNAQVDQATQTVRDRQNSLVQQKQEKINLINQAQQAVIDNTAAYKIAQNRVKDAQAEVDRYQKLYRSGAITEVRAREAESLAKERIQSLLQAQASLEQSKLRLKEQQDSAGKTTQQAQAEIQQAELRLKEQQGSSLKTVDQLKADITQSELRLVEQQRSLQSLIQSNKLAAGKVDQQFKEVQSQIITLQNEIEQNKQATQVLTDRLSKYTIRADVDGSIFELPTTREGAVMQPKQLIAEIAPTGGGNGLVFKGEIPASQSESLRSQGIGKEVRLKFDEFPFETYGVVNGKLNWISPNSQVTQTSGGNVINYEVKVQLAKNCINYQRQCLPFKSGQPATAEIIIRRRRIIDLITDPFTKLRGS
jgi:hemolysin D